MIKECFCCFLVKLCSPVLAHGPQVGNHTGLRNVKKFQKAEIN